MEEPLKVAINVKDIENWIELIEEGLHPKISYREDDPEKMLKDAYEERRKSLLYIAQRLNNVLQYNKC